MGGRIEAGRYPGSGERRIPQGRIDPAGEKAQELQREDSGSGFSNKVDEDKPCRSQGEPERVALEKKESG